MSEVMKHFRAKLRFTSGEVQMPFTATSERAAEEFVTELGAMLDADAELLGPWEKP